ncbi:scavenger receptor cysteine-rich type 1 protein M130-like [Pseudophryne corroboree]|uniref:scavenger receptor cysteine-rich type 1 protein M130-like n=1 Tax=Pseudophryne corroboree TaxID=495146 RepID=UPI00308146BE
MELALPLSCYLLWLSRFGLSGASALHSTLVTFQNESVVESWDSCEGIVFLISNQSSNLVCDNQWSADSPLAHVVCRESGCGAPNITWTLKSSPQGSFGAIQGVQCTGNETSVSECENTGRAVQLCAPDSIAVVSCNQNVTDPADNNPWRLSMGRSSCDGHIEVLVEGGWSPLCFTSIQDSDAPLLCQQMGCKPQRPIFSAIQKGKSPLEPVMLQCLENRTSVWDCDHQVADICVSGLTTYLQCNRSRMEESWLVWLTICAAALMIVVFCWVRVVKSCKGCTQCLHKNVLSLFCKQPRYQRKMQTRRNIHHREVPNLIVQESHSPPSSPAILQDTSEVNALLAPHGFRLHNTITPPPSYMHALRVLSRPLENTQTPPPSYLEALKILSRPVLVHVNATEYNDEKEDLGVLTHKEKEEDS